MKRYMSLTGKITFKTVDGYDKYINDIIHTKNFLL